MGGGGRRLSTRNHAEEVAHAAERLRIASAALVRSGGRPHIDSRARMRSLLPDCVGGTLDKRFDLFEVLGLQLACEIGHAEFGKLLAECRVLELCDRIRIDISEIGDVAAFVDARHAVAEQAIADIEPEACGYIF